MVDGAIIVPVNGQRHSLGGGPARDAIKLLLVGITRSIVVIHAPGDAFADAVEAQQIVAGAHRQEPRVSLKILEFLSGTWRKNAVDDAYRQCLLTPQPEQRRVIFRCKVVPAGVDHSGEPEPVQFPQETTRAIDSLFQLGLWQARIQRGNGRTCPDDPAGSHAIGVALEFCGGRQIFLGFDAKHLAAHGVDQHRAVEELDVYWMSARHGRNLGLRRPPGFGKLAWRPPPGHDQPRTGLGLNGGRPETIECLDSACRSVPAHLIRMMEAGAN
ncbi:hypothetical protein GALL_471520 [mine drainage metagenome]|uniref:Uncharacterized protein n=1 Tax=mine drainage metagenome TaxID=410659 RepID=A0A1J5PI06_9ZZZZ